METKSNTQETSKRISLEARLEMMVFNSATCGFLTHGIMEQVLRENYPTAVLLALFDVGIGISVYYQGKKAIEDYRK
jgi:hypothetical protein